MKQIHKYIVIFSIYCILIILYAILTTNNHILYGDICIWSAVGTIIYLSCLSGENESIKDLLKRYPKPIKSCKLEGT
jgi:hypothetical protein